MSNINIPTQVSPFANSGQFPTVGKTRVIYIDQATNEAYYWNLSTSTYISLGGGASSIDWGSIGGNILDQTDLQTALSGKVDKVAGKGLSTNDYTTTEKNKLAGIEAGAQVNVNADWNATTGDAVILNKPTIPTAVTKTSDLTNDGSDGINPFITAGDIPTFASADKMVTVGRNATGSTLYKGTIVYISGSTGNRPNFVKSRANTESTSAGTFGVIENDIPNNSDGNCVTIGTIENLDTRSAATHPFTSDTLADGDTIYLSPTTAGYITNVKPSAPNHLVYIGKVVRTSPTNGTIVYRIQNGYELDEIHDVAISSLANNDILQYDLSTDLWKNETLANAGIQETLQSGTNIKTINGSSVLGSGDLVVSGGGGVQGVHAILPLASGQSTYPSTASQGVASTSIIFNRVNAVPFIPNQNITTSSLYINVAGATPTANARILIYSSLNGSPDQKLYESTNLDCSTIGIKTATTTFNFVAGTTYWLCVHTSANFNLSFINSSGLFPLNISGVGNPLTYVYVTATFGSAPTTFGTPIYVSGNAPFIGITKA